MNFVESKLALGFSYREYDNLLRLLLAKDYYPLLIGDGRSTSSKRLYLRHDVDIDYLGVLPLADIEKNLGVMSTWYFRDDCPIYNLASTVIENIIKKLVSMGHQVGLHIDATRYGNLGELKIRLEDIYSFYGTILPLSRTLSFHKPGSWLLEGVVIDNWVNAYEKAYYSEVVYVSDSNRREFWKEERLISALSDGKDLTLLTHPMWWHEKEESSDEIFFEACRYLGNDSIHQYLSQTSKRYSERILSEVIR